MRILITGANGFVGSQLRSRLHELGHEVATTARNAMSFEGENAATGDHFVCNVLDDRGWDEAMDGCDAVVHLAARVHQMNDTSSDPLAEFREVNRDGSLRVAEAAIRAGVKRLVFLSTIKVLGSSTRPGQAFSSDSPLKPEDPYSVSKAEAEQALLALAPARGLEVTVIRPPLIYGRGVKGNLVSLARWIRRGVPLPFGSLTNRRDLVGLENLCDAIAAAVQAQGVAGQCLLVADGEPVSTPQLIRAMAAALGTSARLVPVPARLLAGVFGCAGRQAAWERLAGNLEVDISATRRMLGWSPRLAFGEGMARAFGNDASSSRPASTLPDSS